MKRLINLVPITTHLLFAAACAMAWKVATRGQLDWITLAAALVGAILPDVDITTSLAGRLVPPLSRALERRFGHRQEIHTIWVPLGVWGVSLLWPIAAWTGYLQALALGYLSHLVVDTLNPTGIAFLLPLSKTRITLLGGRVRSGTASEVILLVVVVLVTLGLTTFTRFEPGEFVQNLLPTLDTAREQYRQWEGLYTVYAEVVGTWNETHQRYSGQAEIVGLDPGGALVLRDLPTEGGAGRTFTAGKLPSDDLYVGRITLRKGERLPQAGLALQAPTPPPPTPIVVTILVEGIRNPDLEIIVRPGDAITKGQLIAELLPPPPPASPGQASPPGSAGITNSLEIALAQAELDLAEAEYQHALEGQPPSEAAILQAEASIASLNYLLANNPNLTYVPQQLAAAEARLEEIKKGQAPTYGEIAVAKARLALAKLRYQQAIITPTPAPTPTPAATPAPQRTYSLVNGLVRHIHAARIVGNIATIEIGVELTP